ncbi:response regulator transcription factor [soil metagenome]
MRVLVVEDDDAVAEGIVDGLSDANVETRRVGSAAGCREQLTDFRPDLVLLDLGLPDADGTDLCRELRAASSVPIIIVSARTDEIDRVVALEMGADDFMVKPFGMRELVARIRAVTRRIGAADPTQATEFRVGALTVDTRTRRVLLGETELHFTAKEFELLCYLVRDPGAVYRRSEILHDVWDTNWYGTTKTVDTHIASIRKKLGHPGWIESVRGVGFRFGVPR